MKLIAALVSPLAWALNALLDLPARIDAKYASALSPEEDEL